jgi:hypothetical protein
MISGASAEAGFAGLIGQMAKYVLGTFASRGKHRQAAATGNSSQTKVVPAYYRLSAVQVVDATHRSPLASPKLPLKNMGRS